MTDRTDDHSEQGGPIKRAEMVARYEAQTRDLAARHEREMAYLEWIEKLTEALTPLCESLPEDAMSIAVFFTPGGTPTRLWLTKDGVSDKEKVETPAFPKSRRLTSI